MEKKRALLKIAGFLAGLFIMISLLDIVFEGEFWYSKGLIAERDARLAGFELETPGQIDVLCVGNSLGIVGIAPMELFRDYGITSYNLGCEMQMPVETYYTLKKALKTQKIKVLLWEANNISKHHKKWDAYISRFAEDIRCGHPSTRYHYVWKNAVDGYQQRPYFKGFAINEAVKPYTDNKFYDYSDTRADVFSKEQYYYFDKIQKLCEENDVKLILFSVPSPFCYNIRMHNGLVKLAEEKGVDYFDGNEHSDEIKIDWNEDTFDKGDHLNLFGSRKLTKYLAEHVLSECDLEDHRRDPAYKSWSDLWEPYEKEVKRMKGTRYSTLEKEQRKEKRHRRWGDEEPANKG